MIQKPLITFILPIPMSAFRREILASEQKGMLHAVYLAATSRATACNKVPEYCTQLEILDPIHPGKTGARIQ